MENRAKDNIIKFRSKEKNKKTSKSKGYALYNEGLIFFNQDKDDMALEKFKQAEKEGYITAEMSADMAYLYGAAGEEDTSVKYIKKSLELDETYGYAHWLMHRVCRDNGDSEKELEHLLLAEKHGYKSALLYPFLSTVYNYPPHCDYWKAYEYATKAIAEFPDDPYSYLNKGLLLYDHKEYEKAIKYMHKAEKLGDNTIELLFSLSYSYGELGNFDKALEYANRLIFRDKDGWHGYYRKGFVYYLFNDNARAQEAFLLAEKKNCPEADLYSRLAYTYVETSKPDFDKVVEYVNKAFEINKNDVYSYISLGSAYLHIKNDCRTAKKYFKKAMRLCENSPFPFELYHNYCTSLLYTHQYKLARKYIEEAQKYYPGYVDVYELWLEYSYYTKDYKDARKYFNKICKAEKNSPYSFLVKALFYYNYKPSDYRKCIKYGMKLLKVNSVPLVYVLLAISYYKIKDYEKSIFYLEYFVQNFELSTIMDINYKSFKLLIVRLSKKFPDLPIFAQIQEKYGKVLNLAK